MGSIMIKLNPGKLANADLDLRYVIPEKIEEVTAKKITDNGYDYLKDNSIAIFLKSANPRDDVNTVLEVLKNNVFLENNIYETAEVSVCENDNADIAEYEIVYQP